MPSSYNGWPASRNPTSIGVVRFEPIRGHDFPAGVKGGDVATVITYLVRQLDARVEPIEEYRPGDEWGYSYRANVNNPNQLSCHASGTAIDYNAVQHPNRVDYTWTRAQAREIHQIVDDELDGVVKWLEGWDEMHFEIRGTPSQVRAVAAKIRINPGGDMPLNEADKAWLRQLMEDVGGERKIAEGSGGEQRSDIWRWGREIALWVRKQP